MSFKRQICLFLQNRLEGLLLFFTKKYNLSSVLYEIVLKSISVAWGINLTI